MFLDARALTWRESPAGFRRHDAPAARRAADRRPAAGRNVTYQYDTAAGRAPADPPALEIVTQRNAAYPGYLGLGIQGVRNPDASVTVP